MAPPAMRTAGPVPVSVHTCAKATNAVISGGTVRPSRILHQSLLSWTALRPLVLCTAWSMSSTLKPLCQLLEGGRQTVKKLG